MSIRATAMCLALLPFFDVCRADDCVGHPTPEPPLPLEQFKVVSAFGARRNPFSGRLAFHTGVDLKGPPSAAVSNMFDGRVVGLEVESGGTFTITIQHCGGWVSEYRHVVDPAVAVGHTVLRGWRLASTPRRSEPNHGARVHIGLSLNGRPVDPVPLFAGEANSTAVPLHRGAMPQ
ncbi:M23 family metallopeptidase [Nitrobacter sp.]|uniref:M23 family metallopeptidase n=1 Tax=Nitrobacter sp. TaxID=29420 RepID=UPI003F6514B0